MTTQLLMPNTEESKRSRLRMVLDGALIEFLASPGEAEAEICLIRGTLPAGGFVPLHSHLDVEIFYVLDGSIEAFQSRESTSRWTITSAGDVVIIPGNTRHAWRNSSRFQATVLLVTTSKMYAFFQEISRPFDPSHSGGQPTPEGLQELFRAAVKYGHWMGSPEENAAIGLNLK